MKGSKQIEELIGDTRLLTRVKVENYLLVHLGLRPCSQITLPAELPEAEAMGAAIDERVYQHMRRLSAMTDPKRRRAAIDTVKRELRTAFEEIVEASDRYRAHMEWARALGLRSLRVEVRPTVRELYLFRDRDVGRRLRRLMRRREELRRQALRHPSPDMGRVQFAYPEEFQGTWLREMGELLGYPGCCVKRYASDRERGISVEERAARQIGEAEQRGEVDPLAYFIAYFFPCSPDCEAALSRGRDCRERLREIVPDLGNLYEAEAAENLDRVRRQPDLIARYRARAEETSRRGPRPRGPPPP